MANKLDIKLAAELRNSVRFTLRAYQKHDFKSNLKFEEWCAIRKLKKNQSIKILPADKGNKTVVLDSNDYQKKLDKCIDASDVEPLKKDVTKICERKTKKLLDTISKPKGPLLSSLVKFGMGLFVEEEKKEDHFLSRKDLKRLKPSDTKSAYLYGLPKIHKNDVPVRHICSAVDSPCHEMAKALVPILEPLVGNTSTFVKNGSQFVQLLKERWTKVSSDAMLVSFDVVGLFPSIPIEEALDVVHDRLKKDKSLKYRTDLKPDEVFEMVRHCIQWTYFGSHRGYFKQVDGTPMGGPLSCILADIFMEVYEEEIGVEWIRYRDDTFMIWTEGEKELKYFLEYLNSYHPRIQWTYETEVDGRLPFLDVMVIRNQDGSLGTTVYRKKTHSNRYLHFKSNHPKSVKISTIKTLRHRAHDYCSSDELLQNELDHLLETFIMNGYPADLTYSILHDTPETKMLDEDDDKEMDTTPTLRIPYLPQLGNQIKRDLKRIGIDVVFTKQRTLGDMLVQRRPKLSKWDQKGVVYSIPCHECKMIYIGQTKRKLGSRIDEHRRQSINALRTGHLPKSMDTNDCGPASHALEYDHLIDFDDTIVLEASQYWHDRTILESIHIQLAKNRVMNQMQGRKINEDWFGYAAFFS